MTRQTVPLCFLGSLFHASQLQRCDYNTAVVVNSRLRPVLAMGLVGKSTYLAETWNCLDMFIVITG